MRQIDDGATLLSKDYGASDIQYNTAEKWKNNQTKRTSTKMN